MGTDHLKSGLIAFVLTLAMAVTGSLRADEQQEPSRKAKGSKGSKAEVVEVDLSKLPPDLAEQVRKALSKKKGKQDGIGNKGKGPNKEGKAGKKGKGPNKDQYTEKGPPLKRGNEAGRGLPPGLAKKSADHPGRKAFLAAMNQKKTEQLKQEPKKDKKGEESRKDKKKRPE